ncbi:MAG: PASTA domain-containing protein, partial [Anaerolineae bacterium]|nr:PASTA domain-containing protein [Anaerolineae bacterium]
MPSKSVGLIVLLILLLFTQAAFAQDNVAVPDVTGLNLPQALALLNQNGLRLGNENHTGWTADSGLPQNSVSEQSIPAGQTTAYGTAVDITLLRSPNALVIYDDNDFTLVNQTGEPLDLNAISFNSISGAAAFPANTWGNSLDDG